ncbi:carbamoyl-phosphate synthase L chain, ATP binding domain-containing protein [Kickxella alabastrina]|uniref:carbamoyl-phosphate synthase L chain, ATP binding domain-containing protein n=1 Tax=Kickxella alabastrina TaxID=61397 RepID=UPI0022209B64|nr:carbamoyl-phosphate synthase L chain, ATP binding domain-containing protein [Kickxella alabastrina]KAI7821468.1 carbamoyl-phosphate synthase L chain, ATP binding domain-containing protein [Kickxella alabastrina]
MSILRGYSRLAPGKRRYSSAAAATAISSAEERKPLFDKILIANRGEIACRIMHTARKLGIKTVAAYLIGKAAVSESYLQSGKIIESGAQAVHPGYGFLSENATFADELADAGVTFIGPPGKMGSKSESKRIMIEAGVPVVPGYHGEQQDAGFLKEKAAEIGYPAVLGGGGKGMRIVRGADEFDMMLEASRREAMKSFGDQKYLETPRHVEVQIFADSLGNAVHLFERDCSVQRRHQKIIEEAPAPGLLPEIRRMLGEKAVQAAKAVGYVGAGTVEFIMDCNTQEFFFMEMNTRLQVEHPVTEMVTGTDLVGWQLEVAAGNRLPQLQDEIQCTGHAFEARIYAENTDTGFLPDTGRLVHLRAPAESPDVRVETGVRAGDTISVHYDPMIAKLVVRGSDRREALRVLRKALAEYEVVGVHTNLGFLRRLAASPDFAAGDVETGFIEKHPELFPTKQAVPADTVALAGLALLANTAAQQAVRVDSLSPWAATDSFCINTAGSQSAEITSSDHTYKVTISGNTVSVAKADGAVSTFEDVLPEWTPRENGGTLRVLLGGRLCSASVVFGQKDHSVSVFDQGTATTFHVPQPQYVEDEGAGPAGSVAAPMSCKIVQVLVEKGAVVEKGAPLVLLEAMKMEHVIRAPSAGTVTDVYYKVGELVDEGKSLVAFEAATTTE